MNGASGRRGDAVRDERDLVRTLRAAAVQVEGHDLADGVAHRRRARRTRRRVRVVLAAAAVVAVVAGTAAVVSRMDGRRAEPVTPSQGVRSATEVWPRAIVKVPAKNALGLTTEPVTSLSATEVLLAAISASGKSTVRLEAYDSTTKTTRVLGDVPAPRKEYHLAKIAVSAQYIAWFGGTWNGGKWSDFWIMPRAGGTARRVGEVAANVDAIGIVGDSLVWSPAEGGVYRMPITGGTPARMPRTDGLHLTSWPWAARKVGDKRKMNENRLVNLETGQAVDVPLPRDVSFMRCHPQWCVGMQGRRVIVQRVDGSQRRTLPPELLPWRQDSLIGDRYALFVLRGGTDTVVLYDLSTGTMGRLGPWAKGPGRSSSPSDTPFWDTGTGGGQEFTVVNLAAR